MRRIKIVYRLAGRQTHPNITNLNNGSCKVVVIHTTASDFIINYRAENFIYIDKELVGEIDNFYFMEF